MARPRMYPIRSRLLAGPEAGKLKPQNPFAAMATAQRCPDEAAVAILRALAGMLPSLGECVPGRLLEIDREDMEEFAPITQAIWRAWQSFLAQRDAEQNQVGMADECRDLADIESEARIVAGWIESGADGPECVVVACRLAERLAHFPNRLWAETTTWPRDDALAFENARARLAETVWQVADWLNHRDALAADLALLAMACSRLRASDVPSFTKRAQEARSELQASLEAIYRDHVAPDRMDAWRSSHDANDLPPPPQHRKFAQSVMRVLGVRFEPKPRRA